MTAIGGHLAPGATVETSGQYVCAAPCGHRYYTDMVGHKIPAPPADCAGDGWLLDAAVVPGAMDDHKRTFLASHVLGVLATVRSSGAPQLSQVSYVFDGESIAVCAERRLAKWRNAAHNPSVALWVGEGRRQLVVYGRAVLLGDGPARDAALSAYFEAMARLTSLDDTLVEQWVQEDRGIIRITPERVLASD
jgi:PPOX class probable F420-dependent enzyme